MAVETLLLRLQVSSVCNISRVSTSHLHIIRYFGINNLDVCYDRCIACVADYPMKETISTVLELPPSHYGINKGVKTTEDMKNALTKLSISISVSKEEMLRGTYRGTTYHL